MRWLLTFLAGILLGAGGLFVYLRQIPHDAPGVAVVAPVTPRKSRCPPTSQAPQAARLRQAN
jgi:hypothetical protein